MKRALIIEDDRWLGDSYDKILSEDGFVVVRAEDAESAMCLVEECLPDIIVADVMLQGHTVFALLHELQSYDDTQKIPVVLCSNLDVAVLEKTKLDQYGVRQVLDKTLLKPDQFIETVREHVS